MTIYNLGSINADLTYRVPHLPGPGETLAVRSLTRGLGGKGANMSVAAARAAAHVVHLGAVGPDGGWAVDRLTEYGVDTRHIARLATTTGHAVIAVDDAGENLILIHPGANRVLDPHRIAAALGEATEADTLLMQNETNAQREAAAAASRRGLRIAYAAAPFDAQAVADLLPLPDLLILNAVEAAQLEHATGKAPDALPVRHVVVTMGADGVRWIDTDAGTAQSFAARKVTAVDSTGAGDTFTGYLLAGLDRGMPMAQAIGLAQTAAALMVTRHGTADVIPDLKEVQDARLGPA